MNINVNLGGGNTMKTCMMQHPLTFTQGQQRNFPTCNACGSRGLQSAYTCYQCNYDLCPNCMGGSNMSNMNMNMSQGNTGGMMMGRTCRGGHSLIFTDGRQRNYPTCDQCRTFKLPTSYCCSLCNFDLCQVCYTGGTKIGMNQGIGSTSMGNTGIGSTSMGNTGIGSQSMGNTGIGSQSMGYTGIGSQSMGNTGFSNVNVPYNTGVQPTNLGIQPIVPIPQVNPYNPYSNQTTTTTTISSNPYNPYDKKVVVSSQPYIGIGTGSNMPYKTCRAGHYLTLCDSNTRWGATCDICMRNNLNNTWACFTCDFDMCLTCYDQNCERPTNSLKFCRNRHSLMYADQTTRGYRTCDVCYTSGLLQSYCCYVCDYDLCLNCYNSYSNQGECTIF